MQLASLKGNTKLEGQIEELISNAKSKLAEAELLASQGYYPTASSLLVTAFEERAKATVLQTLHISFPLFSNHADFNYLLNQHNLRHFVGFFADCMVELAQDVFAFVEKNKRNFIQYMDFNAHSPETQEKLQNWLLQKIDSFIEKIDFYQNVEKKRQNGLYIDLISSGKTRKKIGEQDYLFIRERLNSIHEVSEITAIIQKTKEIEVLKSIRQATSQMHDPRFPAMMEGVINLVRKEREKAFNPMKSALLEFRESVQQWDDSQLDLSNEFRKQS